MVRDMEEKLITTAFYNLVRPKGCTDGPNVAILLSSSHVIALDKFVCVCVANDSAEWCGPCKMIAPVLDEIAAEYNGRLKVCKVDVDANPDIPPKFGIRGIPTLIVFKDGNAEATKVGALSKSQLNEFIQEVV